MTGRAAMPAAQTTAPTSSDASAAAAAALASAVASRGVDGRNVARVGDASCVTRQPVRTSMPRETRWSRATAASDASKGARMRGIASTRTIFTRDATPSP